MATAGTSGQLTGNQIVRLAAAISANSMAAIAEGYMDIDDATIKNKKYENKEDAEAFNRDIIKIWLNKNPHNQVQTLAALLYAASDCSYVNPRKIQDILGESRVEGEPPPKGSEILELSQTRADPCNTSVTTAERDNMSEKEFKAFIKKVRPYIGKHMKITRHPWQNTEVNMNLFTKLVLQKLNNESYQREPIQLENYKDLFKQDRDKTKTSEKSLLKKARKKLSCTMFLMKRAPKTDEQRTKKILMKGEPGTGKTTLMKKIVHDWAQTHFDVISLVFFVPLKLVKPGEAIENVIVNKTYGLKGLKVTSDKIKSILETFGSRCLLILDGLDEHAQGQNSDVKEIIQGNKYLDCNIIVTSRPHSTREWEGYFDTIVRVEGFSKDSARKYASCMLEDNDKVDQILEFNPNSTRREYHDDDDDDDKPLFKVPILLSIMCFLCLNDEAAARYLKESEQKGFIYFRMVRCLYMTYAEKGKIEFEFSKFVEAVRSVGKLAWQTLLSGNPMFRKKEVIRDFGPEVFEYGLLIGDEDAEGLSDETADILVTFAHRSIQEFFGAFYFILSLGEGESIDSLLGGDSEELSLGEGESIDSLLGGDSEELSLGEGESIDSLLGGDSEEPIFLMNPLFLEFCLWLLYSSDNTSLFSKEVREKAGEILAIYLKGEIDEEWLDLLDLCRNFPALTDSDNEDLATIRNRLVVDLLKDALSRCSRIEFLALPVSWPFDELLSAVNSQIHLLCLFEIELTACEIEYLEPPESDLLIYLSYLQNPLEVLPVALKYCYRAERRPCIHVDLHPDSCPELSELIPNGVHQLHLYCLVENLVFCNQDIRGDGRVSCNQDIPPCPSLRQFSVKLLKNGDHVLSALRKAIQCGNLPKLNYLDFSGCSFNTEGILRYLFGTQTPALEYLNLMNLKLNKSDLQFITELRTLRYLSLSVGPRLLEKEAVQFLFPSGPSPQSTSAWDTLSELYVNHVDMTFWEEFVRAVNQNMLSNLEEIHLSRHEYQEKTDSDIEDISFLELQAEKLPSLKLLFLAGFINSEQEVQDLAEKVVKWDLESLQIVCSKGVSGNLSVLLGHTLRSLKGLSLNRCELNSDDMRCLGEEQVNLPKLKTLNVSHNDIGGGLSVLLRNTFPSLEILCLSCCELNSDDMRSLTQAREQGRLPKLETLDVRFTGLKNVERCKENEAWKNVKIKRTEQFES